MMKKLSPLWRIPVFCWSFWFVLWLLAGCLTLGRDTLARSNGRMQPFAIDPASLEMADMTAGPDAGFVTTGMDPQLVWRNPDGRVVRTVKMQARYSRAPREMCLFYTTAPDAPFDIEKRVFATQAADGSYQFVLPARSIAALRLDPCSPEEGRTVEMQLEPLAVNQPLALWQYFTPGWAGLFAFILCPALLAAAASLVQAVWAARPGKSK